MPGNLEQNLDGIRARAGCHGRATGRVCFFNRVETETLSQLPEDIQRSAMLKNRARFGDTWQSENAQHRAATVRESDGRLLQAPTPLRSRLCVDAVGETVV